MTDSFDAFHDPIDHLHHLLRVLIIVLWFFRPVRLMCGEFGHRIELVSLTVGLVVV